MLVYIAESTELAKVSRHTIVQYLLHCTNGLIFIGLTK